MTGKSWPDISGVVTMFYYEDLPAAAAFYEDRIGFERVMAFDGIVMLKLAEQSFLALVGAGYGSQQPIAGHNKGAILSIQTRQLESWHARLFALDVEGTGVGVQVGGGGRTLEFKIQDPEGYTIEFFEWIE